jgi:type II secretion system protein J
MTMRRDERGFTLLEILVALTIMSLVMVALQSVLATTLKTRDMLDTEVAAAASGPVILDTIERDLRRAWVMNIQDDVVFRGIDRTLLGESADSLLFLSTTGSSVTRRVDEREVASELVETGYRLRMNPELPDVLELWRRQDFHLDEKPLEDGTYERLHDRVISFDVQYYEDFVLEHEELDEWDSEERHELPAVLMVRLSLEVGPRLANEERDAGLGGDQVRSYERVIVLGNGPDLAMRVHPYPPDFSGALDGTGGTGASGEDGEGDEDGLGDELGDPDGGDGGGGDGGDGSIDLGELLEQLAGGGG